MNSPNHRKMCDSPTIGLFKPMLLCLGINASDNCTTDYYRGPSAASEKCVANVQKFLRGLENLYSYWNIHAFSQLVLTTWSWTSALPKDYPEIVSIFSSVM